MPPGLYFQLILRPQFSLLGGEKKIENEVDQLILALGACVIYMYKGIAGQHMAASGRYYHTERRHGSTRVPGLA